MPYINANLRRQTSPCNASYTGYPGSAHEILAQIGMADQANANLSRLPTSLLRRLAFGRAMLHNPQVLLLYEPFARCDEATITLLSGVMTFTPIHPKRA